MNSALAALAALTATTKTDAEWRAEVDWYLYNRLTNSVLMSVLGFVFDNRELRGDIERARRHVHAILNTAVNLSDPESIPPEVLRKQSLSILKYIRELGALFSRDVLFAALCAEVFAERSHREGFVCNPMYDSIVERIAAECLIFGVLEGPLGDYKESPFGAHSGTIADLEKAAA